VPESSVAQATRSGPGRLLIAVYAVFALSASARSVVQIGTQFHKAPLAYVLSAFAALVYILATVCLARASRTFRRIATVSCSVELVGVLAIGTASAVLPSAFPDATVWSLFGMGYGFVPVLLPIWGLWWIRRTSQSPPP
jgi:NhaP-type Na+/H+ and K+/H+ antiporter